MRPNARADKLAECHHSTRAESATARQLAESERARTRGARMAAIDPSTSGAEELTSEDEVARLLNCTDHYSAFGFRPYEIIDVSVLKREYKKKVMLKIKLMSAV